MAIRRRGKGPGGGQFSHGARPADPTAPIEIGWPPPPIVSYTLWMHDDGFGVTNGDWREWVQNECLPYVPADLHKQLTTTMASVGNLLDVLTENDARFVLLDDPKTGSPIIWLERTDHHIET